MVNGCDATSSSYFYAYNGYDLVIGSIPFCYVCLWSFLDFLMVHSRTYLRCLNVGFHTLDYCYMYRGTGSANCIQCQTCLTRVNPYISFFVLMFFCFLSKQSLSDFILNSKVQTPQNIFSLNFNRQSLVLVDHQFLLKHIDIHHVFHAKMSSYSDN